MAEPLSAVSSEPPDQVSVGAAVAHGWDRLKTYFWPLVGLAALVWLFQIPAQTANIPMNVLPSGAVVGVGLFAAAYTVLVMLPLGYGMSFVGYRASTGNQPTIRDLFEGFRHYGAAVGSGVLVVLIVIGGLVLLIIPGLIFAWKLMLVPYLVVVERQGATDAVRESWRRTKGHVGTLGLFWLASVGILIVGLLLLFVGVFPASVLITIATAGLYRAISDRYAGEGLEHIGEGVFEDTARPADGVGEG